MSAASVTTAKWCSADRSRPRPNAEPGRREVGGRGEGRGAVGHRQDPRRDRRGLADGARDEAGGPEPHQRGQLGVPVPEPVSERHRRLQRLPHDR